MDSVTCKCTLWKRIFMVLGIIFTVIVALIIAAIVAIIIIKPYGIDITAPFKKHDAVPYDNPLLTPTQEKALQNLGIDPAVIPTSLTPQQQACGIQMLGKKRVQEILSGATPTAAEIYELKSCF